MEKPHEFPELFSESQLWIWSDQRGRAQVGCSVRAKVAIYRDANARLEPVYRDSEAVGGMDWMKAPARFASGYLRSPRRHSECGEFQWSHPLRRLNPGAPEVRNSGSIGNTRRQFRSAGQMVPG
jgi:hypothetical protein